jgi:hypothetical protein
MPAAIAELAGAEPATPTSWRPPCSRQSALPTPPLRLALGADAVEAIRAAQDRRRGDLDAWEHVSRDMALDGAAAAT